MDLMIGFVFSSLMAAIGYQVNALSKLPSSKTEANKPSDLIVAKGSRRDIWQVFANGGVAAVASLAYLLTESMSMLIVYVASLAAATADTWASELGKFSKSPPRDCFSWKKVEPGTSGAISLLGTGALAIG